MARAHLGDSNVKSHVLLPPRRPKLLGIFLVSLLVVMSPIILFLGYSEARFRHEVNARHARGQRILPEDFNAPSISDENNAATYLHQAAVLLKPNELQEWWIEHVRGRPLVPEQMQYASELRSAHADALAAIRTARQVRDVNWHVRIASPALDTVLPHLNEQRTITRVLFLLAPCEHEAGDDEAAIETLRDLLFISRCVDQQAFSVSHLVALGIEDAPCHIAIRIAPTLRIDSAATRSAAHSFLAELTDETPRQVGQLEAWEYDRMQLVDSDRNAPFPKALKWVGAAVFTWDAFNVMHEYDIADEASRAPTWRGANSILKAIPKPETALAQTVHGTFARTIKQHLMLLTERRVAATAIAIRLYEADHNGNSPHQLSELVPDYLPSVPLDPFSPGGQPLCFIEGNPTALYSVGVDELDGHGDRSNSIDRNGIYNPWLSPDAVFPLGGVLVKDDWNPQKPQRAIPGFPGAVVRKHRIEH